MANLSLQRVGELIRAVFELLWNRPDGLPAKEIMAFIPELVQLTDHEKGISYLNNMPKYERLIRISTIPLARVGWLVKSNKGRWYITEAGRLACRRFPNANELYKEALRIFNEHYKNTPDVSLLIETAQEKAWEQIQKYLQETGPVEFQSLVANLLRAMGYYVAWVSQPEKDARPIDMLAYIDPIGAKGTRILVQIKHKGQATTLEGLKAFSALLTPSDFGLLISTGGFTNDVKEELMTQEFRRMHALDLEAFFDLWIGYYDKLSQESRNQLPLKPINFLAPRD